MNRKKLLILGGKPIGSCELVRAAQNMGYHTIVADYLPIEESPAKQLADESWNISTGDIAALKKQCLDTGIDGVLAGVHEFNLQSMAALAKELDLPCYCTEEQQRLCEDKSNFKQICLKFGIDVAREYSEDEAFDLSQENYPLAVKPRDGSGSRGFTKCFSGAELEGAISRAKENSMSGDSIIEEFIDANALVAQYTMRSGKATFCGLTDKLSLTMGTGGAPVMALQCAPSVNTSIYLDTVDQKVKTMLESLEFMEGPVWIEFFNPNGRFVLNEIGYRFGGSLTYHLVKSLYDVNQLENLILYSLGEPIDDTSASCDCKMDNGIYFIWPLHLKPGTILRIEGMEWLEAQKEYIASAQVHWPGDEILSWGSAQQVFSYLHIMADDVESMLDFMKEVLEHLRVVGEGEVDLLYALLDPTSCRRNDGSNISRFIDALLK